MAKKNRHLRGDINDITLPVHGNIVVEKGDFILEFKDDNSIVAATSADGYGYPASSCRLNTAPFFVELFAGVAMSGSISGVTNDILVATSGQFRYPLESSTNTTLKAGMIVSGVTGSSATSITAQQVVCKIIGTENPIGRCVLTESSATNCDFELLTRYSGVSYFDIV